MRHHEAVAGALIFAAAITGVALSPRDVDAAGGGSPRCDRCQDLPKLEKEVFEQEFLANLFRQYWMYKGPKITPCPGQSLTSAMVNSVTAAFNAYLQSAAGGNKRAVAPKAQDCGKGTKQQVVDPCKKGNGPGASVPFETYGGTCETVVNEPYCDKDGHTQNKQDNVDSPEGKKYIESHYCKEIADYLLAHEAQHAADCKNKMDLSDWNNYAMSDAKAYLAGVRNLRSAVAKKAKDCGWEGSTNDTKKGPDDQPMDTMPTMKQAQSLAKSLGGKK